MIETKKKKKTAKVYSLVGGEMEKITIGLPDDFPEDILKVDDWFGPQTGELCIINGKLDVVKDIMFIYAAHPYPASYQVSFENTDQTYSKTLVHRIEVKRGKVFVFNGKPFVHQESLDGGYIEKMAQNKQITKYEYEHGK